MKPFKRSNTLTAPYYVQFRHAGRLIQYCTGRTDYQEACAEGMRHAAEIKLGVRLRAEVIEGTTILQQITDRYMDLALHVKRSTRVKNLACFLRMIGESRLKPSSRLDDLTKQVVIKFQTDFMRLHPDSAISCNSVVRQARSIFSKRCMPLYDDLLPADLSRLNGFMQHPLFPEPRNQYTMPDADKLKRLMDDAKALKEEDPAAYVAFNLSLYAGLRAGEMVAAKWEWVKEGTFIAIPATYSKSGSGRVIPIHKDVLDEIKQLSPGDYIVPGKSAHARRKAIYYRHSQWVAERIGRKKTNHELRKLFGSHMATKHGLYAAQTTLGHADPSLTSRTYSALVTLPSPLEPRHSHRALTDACSRAGLSAPQQTTA